MIMITSFFFSICAQNCFTISDLQHSFYSLSTNLGIGAEKGEFLVFEEKWKSEIAFVNQGFNISIPIILRVVNDFYFH